MFLFIYYSLTLTTFSLKINTYSKKCIKINKIFPTKKAKAPFWLLPCNSLVI